MTLKDKAKTYNFWISLVSAAVLIVRIIGNKFNIFIDTTLIMDITTGLCSIFVVLGILSAPKPTISSQQTDCKNEVDTDKNTSENTTSFNNTNILEDIILNKQEAVRIDSQIETSLNDSKQEFKSNNESEELIDQNSDTAKIKEVNENNSRDLHLIEIIEKLKAEIDQTSILIKNISSENKQ